MRKEKRFAVLQAQLSPSELLVARGFLLPGSGARGYYSPAKGDSRRVCSPVVSITVAVTPQGRVVADSGARSGSSGLFLSTLLWTSELYISFLCMSRCMKVLPDSSCYEGCSKSSASCFIVLAHDVKGGCWWSSSRG